VTHRAPAPLGSGQAQQPQHGGRHHRRLAGTDGQAAHDQQRKRRDKGGDRAGRHKQCAADHDPRRPQAIGQPAPKRPSGRAGQRGRADREADQHRLAAERMHVVGQDSEHRTERGVAEHGGEKDDEVASSGHTPRLPPKRFG
jgi:hypothetical protein